MRSAGLSFRVLRVFFIKFLFLSGVFTHLQDEGIQLVSDPSDRPILFTPIRTLVKVIRVREDFLRLLEPNFLPGARPQLDALALFEMKSYGYNSYTP